jgi:hypothetical protein
MSVRRSHSAASAGKVQNSEAGLRMLRSTLCTKDLRDRLEARSE